MSPLRPRFRPFTLWVALLALASWGCHKTAGASALAPREQARLHLAQNKPDRALPLLERLHAQQPEDLEVARLLTDAKVRAGQTEAWIVELEARRKRRAAVTTDYMLGLSYFSRAEDAAGPAIAAFERAVTGAPQTAELHYRLALAYLESERYEAALAPLRRAAALAPERAALQLPLALALLKTGQRTEAVAALRALAAGRPTPAEVSRARQLMDLAFDPFARFPESARSKFEEGLRFLQELDAPQPAILAFEEVLRDYPDLAVVHALVGLAYQRLDDAGRAVDEFKRAIELAPEDGKNHFYLGELYASRQRADAARAAFEQAVALNPLLDAAWFRLGDLHLERRDLGAAERAFRTVTYLAPDALAARGKLALVHQLLGDWRAAEGELRTVLDKDPENLEFALRLGLLLAEQAFKATRASERQGLAREAEPWLRKVLDLQPDNALASRALERLRAK